MLVHFSFRRFSSPRFLFQRSLFQRFWFRHLAFYSLSAALALGVISSAVTPADAKPQRQSKSDSAAADIARGKYLVEGVAMCGQCHTPRDSEGNFDRSRWLQGGPVPYQPSTPTSDWPQTVPRIGGTPPGTDVDMIKLLTTGIWNTGNRLRSPMPQFRMDPSDAEAIVAYLKSLMPKQ